MRPRNKTVTSILVAALFAGTLALGQAVPAAAAGTTYYVDATTGSDANSGSTAATAWKSLSKVNALTLAPGDNVLLRAGSVWQNQYLDLRGSGTAGSPIVVGSYGAGARPRIDFGNSSVGGEGFGVRITNGSYWHIAGLEVTSGTQSTSMRRNGILILGSGAGGGAFRHIQIVGNWVHHIYGNDRRTGGINIHARQSSGAVESTWDDVLIQDNIVDDVADTGIQTMTDALLDGSTWTHRTDAFTRLAIRGNTVTAIHRDGILTRASTGALIEHNTTDRIGKYTTADTSVVKYLPAVGVVAAQWAYSSDRATFQYNQASRTRRIEGDGQPWDFDVDVTNSVYQYNYSFLNEGGTLLMMDGTAGNVFRYNISQDDFDRSGGAFSIPFGGGSLDVYNNVFYRSAERTGLLTTSNSAGRATYRNNVFYNLGSGSYGVGGGAVYASNTFFGAHATVAPDATRLTSDPGFTAPGGATSITDAAAAYTLSAGSASRDSGVVIAGNGGVDFSGRLLPATGVDRGAVEGTPAAPASASATFETGSLGSWAPVTGAWTVGGMPGSLTSATASAESIASAGSLDWADYTVDARVSVDSPSGNVGVLVRYTDASNFLMLRVNDATDSVELYRRSGGAFTLVTSAAVPVTPGRFVALRADAQGPVVTGWVDGVKLVSWTNPAATFATGKVGVRAAAAAARADEIVVRR
jgi:hypothetical protein